MKALTYLEELNRYHKDGYYKLRFNLDLGLEFGLLGNIDRSACHLAIVHSGYNSLLPQEKIQLETGFINWHLVTGTTPRLIGILNGQVNFFSDTLYCRPEILKTLQQWDSHPLKLIAEKLAQGTVKGLLYTEIAERLLFAGEKEQAIPMLQNAEEFICRHSLTKASLPALAKLATVKHQAGFGRESEELILQIKQWIDQIKDPQTKAMAEAELAVAYADMDNLSQAGKMISTMTDSYLRNDALERMARSLGRKGQAEDVKALTERIDDVISQYNAFQFAAEELAGNGNFSQALELIQQIDDAEIKGFACGVVTNVAARKGDFARALAIAQSCCAKNYAAYPFEQIAEAYIAAGEPEKAREMLKMDIPDLETATALSKIGAVYATRGEETKALSLLPEIEDIHDRLRLLIKIAAQFVIADHNDDHDLLQAIDDAARELAKENGFPVNVNNRTNAGEGSGISREYLEKALSAQDRLGFVIAMAKSHGTSDEQHVRLFRQIFALYHHKRQIEAENLLMKIMPYIKQYPAMILDLFDTVYAQEKQSAEEMVTLLLAEDQGQQLQVPLVKMLLKLGELGQTLTLTDQIISPELKIDALMQIAIYMDQTQEKDLAIPCLEEAEKLAEQEPDKDLKTRFLLALAHAYQEMNAAKKSQAFLVKAISAAEDLSLEGDFAMACLSIVDTFIESNQFTEALDFSATLPSPSARNSCRTRIASAYARMQQYDQALALANSLNSNLDRESVIIDVAIAQINHDQLEDAVLLAQSEKEPRLRATIYEQVFIAQLKGHDLAMALDNWTKINDVTVQKRCCHAAIDLMIAEQRYAEVLKFVDKLELLDDHGSYDELKCLISTMKLNAGLKYPQKPYDLNAPQIKRRIPVILEGFLVQKNLNAALELISQLKDLQLKLNSIYLMADKTEEHWVEIQSKLKQEVAKSVELLA